jgi:hypothetical protein
MGQRATRASSRTFEYGTDIGIAGATFRREMVVEEVYISHDDCGYARVSTEQIRMCSVQKR